jgi:hypothetical protein
VIANIVGDQTPFTMPSPSAVPANSTRSFSGLKQAADENAESRVQAGIHFRFACEAGQEMGDKIGQWMINLTADYIFTNDKCLILPLLIHWLFRKFHPGNSS